MPTPTNAAPALTLTVLAGLAGVACGGWGRGSDWVKEPLAGEEMRPPPPSGTGDPPRPVRRESRTIGGASSATDPAEGDLPEGSGHGRVLGRFRNTYYDFPSEREHAATGPKARVMNATCEPIAEVPRGFYEALCVQGSGALARGATVSFARRDCPCADVCPRTGQRVCFEELDASTFPHGRGAAGRPIVPLRTVAADPELLPLGTVLYLPELDGATTENGTSDGCFVVEDRGLKVRGEHIDVFAGSPSATKALGAHLPSNTGVTVVLDAPRCAHLAARSR